jgi:hypothetical protein
MARYIIFRYIVPVSTGAMTEQAFFVLAALVDQPRHGYGIVGEVAGLSDGRVRLKVGTLYGCWTGWSPAVWSNWTGRRSRTAGCAVTTG